MKCKEKVLFEEILIDNDTTVDYQTIIEEKFGNLISKIKEYDPNFDCNPKYNNGIPYTQTSNAVRAYFNTKKDEQIVVTIKRVKV